MPSSIQSHIVYPTRRARPPTRRDKLEAIRKHINSAGREINDAIFAATVSQSETALRKASSAMEIALDHIEALKNV